MAACALAAFLLGPCVIQCHGQVIEGWRGAKVARVVRYLMFRSGRPAHRDMLIETFWPECDAEVARRNLHQTMYLIRRVLRSRTGLEHIAYENEAYAVDCRAGFWCDVEEFEARVAAGRCAEREGRADEAIEEFERGIALYAGDLLEDMPYEDWALTSATGYGSPTSTAPIGWPSYGSRGVPWTSPWRSASRSCVESLATRRRIAE